MNGTDRAEREREATHLGSLAHLAFTRAEEATRAVRIVEVDQQAAFELVREAEALAVDAGVEIKVGMNAELTASYRVWAGRVDGEPAQPPEFLR